MVLRGCPFHSRERTEYALNAWRRGYSRSAVLALVLLSSALAWAAADESPGAVKRQVWADERTNTLGAPSPDGRYLSFVDTAGNLAVRDLASGTSRALTSSAGGPPPGEFAYFSVFSHDSQQVAYAWFNEDAFYELRMVAMDGSAPRTLYRNREAGFVQPTAFLPEGDQILTLLFRRDNVSQIALVSTVDGSARVLRSLDWFYPKKIDVSPDGRFVVYDSIPSGESAARDIHLLAVDGSTHGVLTDSPANDLFPLWTPDGRSVVFGSDRDGTMDAWMVPVRDGRRAGEAKLVARRLGRALPMAFTSDWVLFYGLRAGRTDVYVGRFDASTGMLQGGASAIPSRFAGGNRNPEWSPDGRFMAYLSRIGTENYGQEHRAVTVRDVASGNETVHTPRLAFIERVRWSPDGSALLISGGDAQGRSGLFVMDLKSGEATQAVVERTGDYQGLHGDWSADGTRIFFAQRSGSERFSLRAHSLASGIRKDVFHPPAGKAVIRSLRRASRTDRLAFVLADGQDGVTQSVEVVDVDRSTSTTILRSQYGDISGVDWIANDERLLVSAESASASSLWIATLGGREPVLLDAPWKRPGPVRVSPDGSTLAFSHEESKNEVWSLKVPRAGP
ncbi:MAG: hypothetical protein OXN89_22605 [Bryobacterales bacterium]|nr:hypothetical protein [Bryobacterales bacterium]